MSTQTPRFKVDSKTRSEQVLSLANLRSAAAGIYSRSTGSVYVEPTWAIVQKCAHRAYNDIVLIYPDGGIFQCPVEHEKIAQNFGGFQRVNPGTTLSFTDEG